jgi:hypothetical protein
MGRSERIRVLITVKAYPQLSHSYGETVCVAGVRIDGPQMQFVRLFPVPFRNMELERQFAKYSIVEVDVSPHVTDTRPESLRPNLDTLQIIEDVPPGKDWSTRATFIRPLVSESMCEIQRRQVVDGTSLGVFRPAMVTDFLLEASKEREAGLEALTMQVDMFDEDRKPLEALPYRFVYRFRCSEKACTGHRMGSIDWEIGAAYLNWRRTYPEHELPERLRRKWFEEMTAPRRDLYFFVGNVHRYPKTFVVLGAFYPKTGVMDQMQMF